MQQSIKLMTAQQEQVPNFHLQMPNFHFTNLHFTPIQTADKRYMQPGNRIALKNNLTIAPSLILAYGDLSCILDIYIQVHAHIVEINMVCEMWHVSLCLGPTSLFDIISK